MRIKEAFILLKEQTEKEKAEQLASLFEQGEYRNDFMEKIYRGYDTDLSTWDRFNIRKDRNPVDTDEFFDDLIFYLEELSKKLVPKRTESKFGTTFKSEASRYGQVYMCFPDSTANIVSLDVDAFTYFDEPSNVLQEIGAEFYDIRENEEKFSEDPEFREFIINVRDITVTSDPDSIKEVAKKVWNKRWWLINMSNKYGRRYQGSLIRSLDVAVNKIHHYFEDMERGVEAPADEIIFDGESYIMADESWFMDYFEWTGSVWKLKEV